MVICLFAVVIAEAIMLLVGHTTGTLWDMLIVLLFSLFIGYDWSKAQSERKTAENALDAVFQLYLDILNIFIRLLNNSSDD